MHLQGNPLAAIEKGLKFVNWGQFFSIHDGFHPFIMNGKGGYVRLISCWKHEPLFRLISYWRRLRGALTITLLYNRTPKTTSIQHPSLIWYWGLWRSHERAAQAKKSPSLCCEISQ